MQYLDAERVQQDRVVDDLGFVQGRFLQMDLGSATGVHFGEHWWSSFSPSGVAGEATLATPAKGRLLFERAAGNLVELVRELRARPDPALTRLDRHQPD